VTTIALMLLEPSPTVEERLAVLKASRQKQAEAVRRANTTGAPPAKAPPASAMLRGGHLIVCPTSVLRQWARELRDKVSPTNALSVLVHHGPDRAKNPLELLKCVVPRRPTAPPRFARTRIRLGIGSKLRVLVKHGPLTRDKKRLPWQLFQCGFARSRALSSFMFDEDRNTSVATLLTTDNGSVSDLPDMTW